MREATLPILAETAAAAETSPPAPDSAISPDRTGRGPVVGWGEALAAGALTTVWSFGARGFHGARWSDVPIIKSFVDERLYRQDPFIWALHDGTPAAYPYQVIATFARALPWLSFDQALLLLYLPATIAALALLYRLGLALTGERAAAGLFLVLYVAGYRLVTVGSAILHSAELTPQVLALPLQLGSIYLLLHGRLLPAGLLMGLAFNLHVPTTVYLAAALGVYTLLSVHRFGPRPVALSLGLVVLAAAPTVIGSLLSHGDQLPLWALNLAKAELATDISFTIHFSNRGYVIYNLLGLGLAALSLRRAPPGEGRRLVFLFLVAVGLMCLGAVLFFDLSLRTPLSTLVARLQLPRAAWILNVFGLLYLALYLVRGWRDGRVPRPLALLLVAGMLAAPPDFVPLDPLVIASSALVIGLEVWCLAARRATDGVRRLLWSAPWLLALLGAAAGVRGLTLRELDFELSLRTAVSFAGLALGWAAYEAIRRLLRQPAAADSQHRWASGAGIALGLLVAAGVGQYDEWRTAAQHRGGLNEAAQFQEWARTQTPVDSVFLLLPSEPNNNSFYENAERAVFLVRERANQAVYFRAHNFEFERRVKALGIEQPLRYREQLDFAYRRLTEDQVRALAREFGVTHFVPARTGSFSFPIVYQSGGWTVYEVR